MKIEQQLRTLATLMMLSLCACGGGGGSSQSSTTQPAASGSGSGGSSPNPVPTISALSPSCAPAGEQLIDGADNKLLVIGPNAFAAGSVVRWNGNDRPTTNDGINSLTALIPASDLAAAGKAVVTVLNPAPGGGTSNSLTFTITTGAVNPQSIAVEPAGEFAYVMNSGCSGGAGGYVSMYTINPTTGVLASIGPPVPTYDYGGYPGSVSVAPSGKFAYVTNSGDAWDPDYGSIAMYAIDATTGALTSTGTIAGNCPGLCFPASLVVDPSGKFAYVATGGQVTSGGAATPFNVAIYSIDATTGALTSIGTISTGSAPVSVGVDPAGRFIYVVNNYENVGTAGDVSMYAIDATTGALASIGTVAAGTGPVSVAVDPSGKFAYVTNSGSNDVSMYTIDATTGALASIGTVAAGTGPVSVAVDPSGNFAYVANSSSNNVSLYTMNSTTGSLTLIGSITAGLSPTSIAIHPSGQFAYVTNSGSNNVSVYSIGTTGTLTLIATTGT